MDINNFYKIKRIEYYKPKQKGEPYCFNGVYYSEYYKFIFNKDISYNLLKSNMIISIITKEYVTYDYTWKFVSNIYIFAEPIHGFKEGDYIYLTKVRYNKEFEEEEIWKFLGNLKNPDLGLIEFCTKYI